MKLLQRIAYLGLGISVWLGAAAACAEAPGIYYSWRELDTGLSQCLGRAESAINTQGLENVQIDENTVAGRSEEATALFICVPSGEGTLVMVVVSSVNDEAAVALREALKANF